MIEVNAVADAYGRGAAAWAEGPTRLYRRLADLLVAFSPETLTDKVVLDLGSGTGVGSRAAMAVGARVFATDLAPAMLRVDQATRPPSAAADARALPFRDRALDVVELDAEVVGMLLWALLPALPLLAVGGYQAAAIAGGGILVLRLLNHWSARSTIQFADGFLQFHHDADRAPGVREDDDVRWRWDRG